MAMPGNGVFQPEDRLKQIPQVTLGQGEVAHCMNGGIDHSRDWSKVALKLPLGHPSETLLAMYNAGLTATIALSAARWNAHGSVGFERMAFKSLRDFGEGLQRSVRAFAAIIDRVNAMTLAQSRGPDFPPKNECGTVVGPTRAFEASEANVPAGR